MYNKLMERSRQLLKALTEAFSVNGREAVKSRPW